MSILQEIGQNVVRLRKQKWYTQERLALEAEMSVSYLREIEHGKANPTVFALMRLAVAMGESYHAIVTVESGELVPQRVSD